MKTCLYCGVKIPHGTLCQSCQKYIKEGGKFHPLPPKGQALQDERGYYICHICGMAYSKLGEHIRRKHHMTVEEYKAEFGLMKSQQLTSAKYHGKMSEYIKDSLEYDERYLYLFQHPHLRGKQTRKGQKQSLQEIEQRRPEQREKALKRHKNDKN